MNFALGQQHTAKVCPEVDIFYGNSTDVAKFIDKTIFLLKLFELLLLPNADYLAPCLSIFVFFSVLFN